MHSFTARVYMIQNLKIRYILNIAISDYDKQLFITRMNDYYIVNHNVSL
jgi:hypothetical protein